jgi:hypothetical protein
MQTCPDCPLLRVARNAGKNPRTAVDKHRWLTISITLLGWLGWRALQDLLGAIPDSNDDFGLF